MQKVLILGAGMVAKPLVKYLSDKNYHITIASRSKADNYRENIDTVEIDIDRQEEEVKHTITESDLVINLLPAIYHNKIAKFCIQLKKNLISTSYTSPEVLKMNEDAKNAGIIVLDEIGFTPGLDHMVSKRMIDKIIADGGKIDKYISLCGGLPAPEAINNPFKFKFAWSPKDMLKASCQNATYLLNGQEKFIHMDKILEDGFNVEIEDIGKFEVFPNRNAKEYIEVYGLDNPSTMFRGTLRYEGFCQILNTMQTIGLLADHNITVEGKTYAELIEYLIGGDDPDEIKEQLADYLNIELSSPILEAFEWLGLFKDEFINRSEDSAFEIVSDLMMEKMMLGENERDMVIMMNEIVADFPDKGKKVYRSNLSKYGSPSNNTAISNAVAIPVGSAAHLILNGTVDCKGVCRPSIADIYNPILDELELHGFEIQSRIDNCEKELILK